MTARRSNNQTGTDGSIVNHVVESGSVTSVLVIDDHPVARQGCRRVLERIGIITIFEAGDVVMGYELFDRHRPEIVVVDLGLRDNCLDGMSLVRRFKSENPNVRILVLSMHADPLVVSRALGAGATGYALKDATSENLLKAFEAVQEGRSYLSDDLDVRLSRSGLLTELTPRELETLTLLSEGKSYTGIAEELSVSYKTVANTSLRLRKKLHAQSLSALVGKAVRVLASMQ
jgi:two-component system, NarL family, invasion response regulator UvrY